MLRTPLARLAALCAALCIAPSAVAALIGPSAYLGFADSPFSGLSGFSYYLEDFEDGSLNTPGVTATNGSVLNFGELRDSVENGQSGASWYSTGARKLTFTFDTSAFGALPTHAGLVWTDVGDRDGGPALGGPAEVRFSAYDASDVLIGTLIMMLGDTVFAGEKAEDRFFGVTSALGIKRIEIKMPDSGDWEMDHLQYGLQSPYVELPAALPLALSGLLLLGGALRRKKAA